MWLALLMTSPALAQTSDALTRLARVERDVAYVNGGGARQSLDVYIPKDAKAPMPLVIWIHGGGWNSGGKSAMPGAALLPYGYVVASINYRLSQDATFPAQIQDCKAAVRFLRAHAKDYNIDPDRIGVWGASAGGHLAALLGTTDGDKDLEGKGGNEKVSSAVQAVIDFSGPADLRGLDDRGVNGLVAKLLGAVSTKVPDKAAAASPVCHVSKSAAPHLIVHGETDDVVPVATSIAYQKALEAAGADSTLVTIPNVGHNISGPILFKYRQPILDFLDKHLKAAKAE
jgi:acetyl esterase/lipase